MGTFRNEIQIDASPETVWETLADFGGVARYNPTVVASRSLSEVNEGVGATRRCDLTIGGGHLEERINAWDEEARTYALDIVGGKRIPPFATAVATLAVRPDGVGSRVTAELVYTLKGGPAGRIMDKTMVTPKFGPAFADLLKGLKHHVETGEVVTEDTPLDYELVVA